MIKNYIIIALSIVVLFLYFTRQDKVVGSNVSGTTTMTIISNGQITGGSNATIQPNGSIAISGANLSIATNSTTGSTSSTHVIKDYSYNNIYVGGVITSTLNYGLTVDYSNKDVSLSYTYMMRIPEHILSAKKSVFSF